MGFGWAMSHAYLAGLSAPVFAQSDSQEKGLRIDQLSLYTTPDTNYQFVEAKPSPLEERISELRKLATAHTAGLQDAYTTVKPKMENTLQFGKDGYTFLKNPPAGFYPRAGVIAVAGVAGLLLAGRGSRVRKVLYSCGFVAACGSLYYPEETVKAAKLATTTVYEFSMQAYLTIESLWKKNTQREQGPAPTLSSNQAGDVQQSSESTSP
ncbi:apolipoprotein O, a [Hemiscyllium ocellatum]|uniref:apolipoprotein O, a n=1 Tax=Hemiscyllium ocellatum TaxID=170820 RepID=UPI002965FC94|nr:apolipoprotein O, a [Hemiscyllium ocellatum]